MKPNQPDLVGEYLHEVDLRLSGLPLLQRRELLADLAAHIATERTERNVQSEGELIEILERLGSPEVVAAAAYEEAGAPRTSAPLPPPFVPARPTRALRKGLWILAACSTLVMLFLLCGVLTFRSSGDGPAPAEATVAPVPPSPARPASPTP